MIKKLLLKNNWEIKQMTKQKLEQLLILINQDNLLENEIMQLNTENLK